MVRFKTYWLALKLRPLARLAEVPFMRIVELLAVILVVNELKVELAKVVLLYELFELILIVELVAFRFKVVFPQKAVA